MPLKDRDAWIETLEKKRDDANNEFTELQKKHGNDYLEYLNLVNKPAKDQAIGRNANKVVDRFFRCSNKNIEASNLLAEFHNPNSKVADEIIRTGIASHESNQAIEKLENVLPQFKKQIQQVKMLLQGVTSPVGPTPTHPKQANSTSPNNSTQRDGSPTNQEEGPSFKR